VTTDGLPTVTFTSAATSLYLCGPDSNNDSRDVKNSVRIVLFLVNF
jgi:hypothetical protein